MTTLQCVIQKMESHSAVGWGQTTITRKEADAILSALTDKAPSAPAGEGDDAQWLLDNYGAGHPRIQRIADCLRARTSEPVGKVERMIAGLEAPESGSWDEGALLNHRTMEARTSEPEARGAWGYAARRTRIDGAPCEASWMTGRVGDGLYMLTSVDPDWQVITLYTHPSPDFTSDQLKTASLAAMRVIAEALPPGWERTNAMDELAAAERGERDDNWPLAEKAVRAFLEALLK